MGIEFINEPPRNIGDISRNNAVEDLYDNVGYEAEFGFDPIYVRMGGKDAYSVFKNILEYSGPQDVIDFEAMRSMLYSASENLIDRIRLSYRKGVDDYIERMIRIGQGTR